MSDSGSEYTAMSSVFSQDDEQYVTRIKEIEEMYLQSLRSSDSWNEPDGKVGADYANYQGMFVEQPLPVQERALEVGLSSCYIKKRQSLTPQSLALLPSQSALPVEQDVVFKKHSTNKQLYKTELCQRFATKGFCNYGRKCQFAHGLQELNAKRYASNFRTKPCINWERLGYCPFRNRCCFKHGEDQDIAIYVEANKVPVPNKNLRVKIKQLQSLSW